VTTTPRPSVSSPVLDNFAVSDVLGNNAALPYLAEAEGPDDFINKLREWRAERYEESRVEDLNYMKRRVEEKVKLMQTPPQPIVAVVPVRPVQVNKMKPKIPRRRVPQLTRLDASPSYPLPGELGRQPVLTADLPTTPRVISLFL